MSMASSSGKAQSTSSIAVPSAAFSAGSISRRRRRTFSSGPSSWPEAMRNRMAYPMAPAAPVTVTVFDMARNLSVDRVQRGQGVVEGLARTHRRRRRLGVRPEVPADTDRLALHAVELLDDRGLVVA